MREEKVLISLLRRLAALVEEEANQNPHFSERLDAILSQVPRRDAARKKPQFETYAGELPDIFTEWKARGAGEFELWLRDLGVPVLRALIKHHGFDSSKRSKKWDDPMKLAHLVSQQLQARMNRGSSFLNPTESP